MTDKRRGIIRKHFVQLQDLNAESIMPQFVAEDLITVEDMERITKGNDTDRQKAVALLMLLMKSQYRAFRVLITALEEYKMPHLAGLLDKAGIH